MSEPISPETYTAWEVMVLAWARAQTKPFSTVEAMNLFVGGYWEPGTPMHLAVSQALHRLPADEFHFTAPPTPSREGAVVCMPTWTPLQLVCRSCGLNLQQMKRMMTCEHTWEGQKSPIPKDKRAPIVLTDEQYELLQPLEGDGTDG